MIPDFGHDEGPRDLDMDQRLDEYLDQREKAEAEEQQQYLIAAIREALTKGVSMESMRWLCWGTGVSYDDVVG